MMGYPNHQATVARHVILYGRFFFARLSDDRTSGIIPWRMNPTSR